MIRNAVLLAVCAATLAVLPTARAAHWLAAPAALAPARMAVVFDIDYGPFAGNPAAIGAIDRAAAQWAPHLKDPITVSIMMDMYSFSTEIGVPQLDGLRELATPETVESSYQGTVDFPTSIRQALVDDAAQERDDRIVGLLPPTHPGAFVPDGFQLSENIQLTTANAKALGLDPGPGSDGFVDVNSDFTFDFDNSDGIRLGSFDFESVTARGIGTILGVYSEVDYADDLVDQGLTDTLLMTPMDLFRFAESENPASDADFTDFPRSLRQVATEPDFFNDLDNQWQMSSGVFSGDGNPANTWKDNALIPGIDPGTGVMDPTAPLLVGPGFDPPVTVSPADLRALDVIGYDVGTAISDLTLDGFVDFDDLTILLANWDLMGTIGEGNIVETENTIINFDDLTFLLAQWTGADGATAADVLAARGLHIPEPSTLSLAVLGLFALACTGRRR